MRAKVEFRFLNKDGSMGGEIIEATGVNLLQCDADATMQFMRKWASKLKPSDLKEKHASLIPDNLSDAAEIAETNRQVNTGEVPPRWVMPGQAENEGQ